jgi:hypothetical protein
MEKQEASTSPEPQSNDSSSGTRKRTRTTLNQLRVLEETFVDMPSPDSKLRKRLSEQLGMSERSIQIWFQNRRAKVKLLKKRAKMKEHQHQEQQHSVKKATAANSLPPVIKRAPLADKRAPMLHPTSQPTSKPAIPRSVAARMHFNRAWSYDMAKDMPPPVVYSPAAHALPYWNYPYYPMGPPAPPPASAYARPTMYHSPAPPPSAPAPLRNEADRQLAADMASLAFSDIMQGQQLHHPQPHPLYHQPPPHASYLLPSAKHKQQSFSLPPQDYRHGSQFSSSPISDMTDESGRRYGKQENHVLGFLVVWFYISDKRNVLLFCHICSSTRMVLTPCVSLDLDLDINSSVEPPVTTFSTVGYLLANTITIGTWHRICVRRDDLQLEYDMNERIFSWHIRTEEYHFKMDVSFDLISCIDYKLSQTVPGAAELVIDTTDVPHFYMDMGPEGWLRCGDFTENAQATHLRQHILSGEASQLRAQVLELAALDTELSNKIHMVEEEENDQPPFASLVNFDWINDEDSINVANGVHRYSSMPILGNPGEDLSWP